MSFFLSGSERENLFWSVELPSGALRLSEALRIRLSQLNQALDHLEQLYDCLEPVSVTRLRRLLEEAETDTELGEVPLAFKDLTPATYACWLEPYYQQDQLAGVHAQMLPLLHTLQEVPSAENQRFQAVYQRGSIGIVMTDQLDRILDCNPAFSSMLGYQPAELTGRHMRALSHPADRSHEVPLIEQFQHQDVETRHLEKRYLCADGTYVWVEIALNLFHSPTGELSHIVRFVLNLSERKRLEAELRSARDQQSERLSLMFEHAPAAIAYLKGPEHVFEVTNAKYTELIGGKQVQGLKVREALPEIEGQGFFELLDGVLQSGEPFIGRAVPIRLDHGGESLEQAFLDFVYQPIPSAGGGFDSIMAVIFDVTELVMARQAAEAAQARAETSEQGLKTFIDNLPELAWTALPDGAVDYYNQRWYDYTGTTFEQMQGWGWDKVMDPQNLAAITSRWKHSLATGEPFEMEFTLRSADGTSRWFLTRVAPVRDAAGQIVRWFGTNTDIHDMKATQAMGVTLAEQSQDVQRLLLELRSDKQAADRQIAQLKTRISELEAR